MTAHNLDAGEAVKTLNSDPINADRSVALNCSFEVKSISAFLDLPVFRYSKESFL